MKSMSAHQVKEMLLSVCDAVIQAKPLLTEVDSAVGDGDHGIGMETGMKKAKGKLEALETSDVYEMFRTVGKTMLMSMGGASGVIFGSMFLSGAKGIEPAQALSTDMLTELFSRSLDEIKKRGKAQVGDKTMVDAFEPAVAAMTRSRDSDLETALACAASAAREGMESTRQLEAKFGRSKTQSTTIGFQDAGATSVYIIFRAMNDYVHA